MKATFLMFTCILAAGLIFVAPTAVSAQTCERCDDSDWTNIQCVTAVWPQNGSTSCVAGHDPRDPCPNYDENCIGEIDPQAQVFLVRPDGTFAQKPQPLTATLSFSAHTVMQERNCKGMVIARVYGAVATAALRERSRTIVI
jgi:hypothetical protein